MRKGAGTRNRLRVSHGWRWEHGDPRPDADLRLPCPLRAPLEEWIDSWWTESGQPGISVRLEGHATRHGNADPVGSDPPVVLHPGVPPGRIAAWKSASGPFEWRPDDSHPLASLRDPLGRVQVLCVNPLVMVADEIRLGRKAPASWEDLLEISWEGKLAVRGTGTSVCETTLFAWESRFGLDSLDGFRRATAAADHPGRMVQALKDRRPAMPPVAVLPLFFARILSRLPGFRLVWPSEGAIASPVCLRVESNASESALALAGHMMGPEFATVTDQLGMPSCRPGSAGVPEGSTFLWPGWNVLRAPGLAEWERSLQERFGGAGLAGV